MIDDENLAVSNRKAAEMHPSRDRIAAALKNLSGSRVERIENRMSRGLLPLLVGQNAGAVMARFRHHPRSLRLQGILAG